MTYLVLARKWRPRSFDTLIGQDHVVRALTHALSTQRLHHAWLFTGTRGVGKTTLSRILAKSLNCVSGITAQPCGTCQACTEIDTGRFVDYVELDAASNRGVDEMTQLLEQAVYAPSSGRFKVYMIDEVHMLTGHAFNAMLKTLEEPPPHVKFILATTDPQKIPVTVLSRCLQFNLKQMTAESIVGHLQEVLDQEGIPFETPALRLLAQAAAGSMRDALSLTDQAIAYSAGNLSGEAIQGMLGTIDQRHLATLLQALATADAARVVQVADELASRGLSYSGALGDLAILLSRVAMHQRVPGLTAADDPLAEDIAALAKLMHPDHVQLFYSVAVHSRNELSLAPDEYAGFVMACLRMLSLVPQGATPPSSPSPQDGSSSKTPPAIAGAAAPAPADLPKPAPTSGPSTASSMPTASSTPSTSSTSGTSSTSSTSGASSAPSTPSASGSMQLAAERSVSASQAPDPPVGTLSASAPAAPAPHHELPANDDIPAWEALPEAPVATASAAAHAAPDDTVESQAPQVADAGPPDDHFVDEGPFEPYPEHDDGNYMPVDEFEMLGDEPPESLPIVFAEKTRKARNPRVRDMTRADWPALAATLPVTGLAAELARQSEWLGSDGDTIKLRVAVRTLAERPGKARLQTVLSEYYGTVIQLDVEYGATGDDTAHAVDQARRVQLQKDAEAAVANDDFVKTLIADFGASVVPGSIRAVIEPRAA